MKSTSLYLNRELGTKPVEIWFHQLWLGITQSRLKMLLLLVLILLTWPFFKLAQRQWDEQGLDPKLPFQVYKPPLPYDYALMNSWYVNPHLEGFFQDDRKADVFFLHGTAYDGGKDWLAPSLDKATERHIQRVQLPNYASPFTTFGDVFAPRYRHASLYSHLNMREDAREAREFALQDAKLAFRAFLNQRPKRPIVLVGLDQGGFLIQAVWADVVAQNPTISKRLVAIYLLETLTTHDSLSSLGLLPCQTKAQTACVMAYHSAHLLRPDRLVEARRTALVWSDSKKPQTIGQKPVVCVNPVLGIESDKASERSASLGATNATGLDWGSEPALTPNRVSARCQNGFLFAEAPDFQAFRPTGNWIERQKVSPYNLYYANLRADMGTRLSAYQQKQAN
jgi:hypothetical protein